MELKTASHLFKFERNELDLGRYELRRAGKRLPLSRMPMELLTLLVEQRGRLVRREEIAARLWPDETSVDVEQGINAAMKRIRAVLNDDAAKPRFIETVVGKGYRFIAKVEEVEEIDPGEEQLAAPVGRNSDAAAAISEPAISSQQSPAPQKEDRGPVSLAWLVGVACVLAAGVAAWYGTVRLRQRTTGIQQPVFRQVTTLIPENRATAAAISPDGSLNAYANADGIFVQAKDGETTALRAPADFVVDELAWFASGTKLVASGFSDVTYIPSVWTVFVTGAPPRLLCMHARKGVPSPDETRIAFISEDRSAISIMGANGEEPRQVLAGPGQDTFPLVFWAPDGRRLDFQRRHYALERRTLNVSSGETKWDAYYERSYESVDLATKRIVARAPDMWIESAAALQDGRILFLRWYPSATRSLQLWEVQTNPATGAFLGAPREIASLPEKDERLYMSGMSVSRDGKEILVLRQSNQYAVFLGDFSSNPPRISNRRRLTLDERTDFPHAWTRDSRAVIFESDRYGNYDIFKQDIDRRTAEPIVMTPLPEVLPQMWPGGNWVLYRTWVQGERYSNSKLMRVPVEGGTPEQVPIGGPLDEFRCAIGTGKRCVLRTTIPGKYYVFYDLGPIRGKGRELARTKWLPGVLGDWDISADGTEVAIPNHSLRDARIRIVSLEARPGKASEREVLLPGITSLSSLTSAADGSGWFVPLDTTVGSRLLYVWRDGRSSSLGDIPGWVVPSPDGRRVAFLNQIVAANAWVMERR